MFDAFLNRYRVEHQTENNIWKDWQGTEKIRNKFYLYTIHCTPTPPIFQAFISCAKYGKYKIKKTHKITSGSQFPIH